jgi:hypothetical protein
MDEGFGYKELGPELEKVGYSLVCHQPHYNKRQGVKDEENIVLCASKLWLLTTTDKNIVLRHRDLLHKHRQSVIFTSNNQEKFETWLTAFPKAKAAIERHWKKTAPSWIGRLHPTGLLEVSPLMRYIEYQRDHLRRRDGRARQS